MLEIISFALGPVGTNTYLAADPDTGEATIIDPAWDGKMLAREAEKRGWRISNIWLTHAHFDHLGGVEGVVENTKPPPLVAIHPDDMPLYQVQGGAQIFGMRIDPGPEPTVLLSHNQKLHIGGNEFEVRHAPGHTPGHVIFYCEKERVAFCGDVIFYGSIGRTDLPGGSYNDLIESIRTQVLTMPDDVRLLSGHGPETNVGQERINNPFLA